MKALFFGLYLIFSVHKSFAQSHDIDKTLTVDGRARQFLIHLPAGFNNKGRYPIIFAFHGGGGEYKKTVRYYHLNPLADENGFIVVYPNAVQKAWSMPGVSSRVKNIDNTVDDVGFISRLLDYMIENFQADSNRVYCTGISRGGIFSLYLSWKLSGRITAIAPVCAGIPASILESFTFNHPTSVLLINGTEDPLISYQGGPGKMNARNAESQTANMIPTEILIAKIVELNHCSSKAIVTDLPDTDPTDNCTATDYLYTGSLANVELVKVWHGGHTWPGGIQYLPKIIIGNACKDFRAEEKIFSFFMLSRP